MNITTGIRSYILEDDTKIIIVNNKLNITNYVDIGHFDDNKIIIKLKNQNLTIKGNNLVVAFRKVR